MDQGSWVALGSVAAVVTAVFTAVMAIAIVITAYYAKATLRAARDDSRERSRPILVAFLEREHLAPGVILLIIRNFGPSIAADVRVTFDPPPPDASALASLPASDMMKWLYERFAEPVPIWAPGWSTSNVVRTGQDELAEFSVTLNYRGPDGSTYDEAFALKPAHIIKETTSSPSKTDGLVKLGQQAVAALQALVRTLRTR